MMRVRCLLHPRTPRRLRLAALGLWCACNFDSAFERYCANNPRCAADAASGLETGPDIGPKPGSGGDSGPDVQAIMPPPKSCMSNSDCWPNEMCSPLGQVCMTLCWTASDCLLPGLDTCDVLTDPSGMSTPKVCQCSASEVCNSFASGFLCASPDELCERLCFTDQDCAVFFPLRVCDKRAGVCRHCLGNFNCPLPAQPRCDSVIFRCTGCIGDGDCKGRPDGLTQCGPTGSCVAPLSSP
jgi:hypothetical protein